MDEFFTVGQAAELMNVSKTTIYRLMDRGELGYTTFSKARRIPANAIRALAQQNLRGPPGSC